MGQVPGPHTHTDRTRDTRVAEPRLPRPGVGRPREGRRLTPDAPLNGGRPAPLPGTAPQHPRGTQPPQGERAKGTVLSPHTRTPAPTASGWWTPTARPEGGQPEEGERLTSDAPHTGERHPPRGRPPATPTAHNAAVGPVLGPHARTNRTRRTPAAHPRGGVAGGGTAPDTRRPSQRWQATPPPGTAPRHPRGTQLPQGAQAKATCVWTKICHFS